MYESESLKLIGCFLFGEILPPAKQKWWNVIVSFISFLNPNLDDLVMGHFQDSASNAYHIRIGSYTFFHRSGSAGLLLNV